MVLKQVEKHDKYQACENDHDFRVLELGSHNQYDSIIIYYF